MGCIESAPKRPAYQPQSRPTVASQAFPGYGPATVQGTPCGYGPVVQGYVPGQPSAQPVSDAGKWSCPACTLVNDSAKLCCQACGTQRPGVRAGHGHGRAHGHGAIAGYGDGQGPYQAQSVYGQVPMCPAGQYMQQSYGAQGAPQGYGGYAAPQPMCPSGQYMQQGYGAQGAPQGYGGYAAPHGYGAPQGYQGSGGGGMSTGMMAAGAGMAGLAGGFMMAEVMDDIF